MVLFKRRARPQFSAPDSTIASIVDRMDSVKFPSSTAIEGWPWPLRALLGCAAAVAAITLTYTLTPLRDFPLLLAFPTVILSAWFFGMWGGVLCAFTEAMLVDSFLTKTQMRLSIGSAREELRLTVFLMVSILLAWAIRRLAHQRAQLGNQELQHRLTLANTERQLAEERARDNEALRDREDVLQIALRTNGMGLWAWDLKGDSIHWSDEVYRIVGREPGSIEPGAEAWLQFIHPEDAEGVSEAVRVARARGTDYHQQYRVLWPDASVRWLESQGKCQRDSEGRPARIVGVVADVTNRKYAEEAMLRAEKLAVAGRLAASVAHEINNPLEAVTNLVYLIATSETTEAVQVQARQALDKLMRVSLITQQTLKFHRQPGRPTVTRLSEILQTALTLFRGKLLEAQITVEVRVVQEAGIACMPGEIQQTFLNLLSNAIEAMPRGGRLDRAAAAITRLARRRGCRHAGHILRFGRGHGWSHDAAHV